MAMNYGRTPSLPPELFGLLHYLQRTGLGAPTEVPQPSGLSTEAGFTAVDVDTVSWEYTPGSTPETIRADGFVLYIEHDDTGDPAAMQILLPAAARSFLYTAPKTQARSYAIAAFHMAGDGLQIGSKVQHEDWKGVS